MLPTACDHEFIPIPPHYFLRCRFCNSAPPPPYEDGPPSNQIVDEQMAAWFFKSGASRHNAYFYPDEIQEIPVGKRLKITVELEEDRRDDYPWSVAKGVTL